MAVGCVDHPVPIFIGGAGRLRERDMLDGWLSGPAG